MTGVRLQTTAPGSAHGDLGFWLQSQIVGQPMAMPEQHLVNLIESINANRYSLPKERKTGARITEGGTAIVEIHGLLVNRSPVMSSFWGLTSYEGLAEQCRRLETHADVKRVVLDIQSSGGMVMGIKAASDAIERLGKRKPVHAIAHDMAASAAYWLAVCANDISIVPDGEAGSIGVRSGHISYAEALDRDGIAVTLFHAGATKVDGSPYRLLSAGEAAEEQFAIDRAYDRFVSHVARRRKMSEDAVRDTDARMFVGQDAIEAGLADRVETLDEMIERLEGRASDDRSDKTKESATARAAAGREYLRRTSERPAGGLSPGGTGMSAMNGAAADGELSDVITRVVKGTLAETRARETEAANTVSKADAERLADERAAAAVAADRERVAAILDHEEAKGRDAMARKLAFSTAMSVDAVVDLLKAAPKAEAKAASEDDGFRSALDARMAKGGGAAAVRPDAVNGGKKPSFAELCAATAKKKG